MPQHSDELKGGKGLGHPVHARVHTRARREVASGGRRSSVEAAAGTSSVAQALALAKSAGPLLRCAPSVQSSLCAVPEKLEMESLLEYVTTDSKARGAGALPPHSDELVREGLESRRGQTRTQCDTAKPRPGSLRILGRRTQSPGPVHIVRRAGCRRHCMQSHWYCNHTGAFFVVCGALQSTGCQTTWVTTNSNRRARRPTRDH